MNTVFINDKELIGVNDIVVSEIDNKIYITTKAHIYDSIEGSLAMYSADDSKQLEGTGPKCIWNKDALILEVENVSSDTIQTKVIKSVEIESDHSTTKAITAEAINSEYINARVVESDHFTSKALHTESVDSEFVNSKKVAVKNWLGFNSKIKDNAHPFKFLMHQLDDKEILLLIANEYKEDTNPKVLMAFEDNRVRFLSQLNVVPRTIKSSIGEIDDQIGDIAIDENFIYYCTQDFDGVTNIWKRSPLSTW